MFICDNVQCSSSTDFFVEQWSYIHEHFIVVQDVPYERDLSPYISFVVGDFEAQENNPNIF